MKMKKNMKNDKGFTLVELLIAVVILAAVTIPFIANFAMTSKVNQKARNNLRVTNTMQNMMEEISAVSSKDIIMQFDNVLVKSSLDIIPGGATVQDFGELNAAGDVVFHKMSPTSSSQYGVFVSDNSVDVKKSPDNKYYFVAKNLRDGKGTYDVRFILDGSSYVKPVGGTGNYYYNDDELVSIAGLNPVYDSVYIDPVDELKNKSQYFKQLIGAGHTLDEIKKNLKREINITIDDLDSSPNENICVLVGSKYTCLDHMSFGLADAQKEIVVSPVAIYQSSSSKKDPRNVYIYLKGNTDSKSSKILDHVVIDNKTSKPVTVYLIRENVNVTYEDPDFPNNTTSISEATYALNVSLKDKSTNISNLYTKLCTNAGNDLSQDVTVKQTPDGQSRAYFFLNNSPTQLTAAEYKQVVKGLENATNADRIFKLKVEVYEPGAVDNKFDPTKCKMITSFDGGTYQ